MSRYPILDVCARVEGHQQQHNMLYGYCRECDDWQGLLKQAELEGMTPLLKKHLDESEANYPVSVRRSLNILAKRHQQQSDVRIQVLQEILELFQSEQLTPIPIKGAALCHTTYPDPGLRPMRDMDILLPKNEVDHAQELLRNIGFTQSKSPIPADHYHLPSLLKTVDGVTICIELHRGLYPNCPPYYPEVNFEQLLKTAKHFKIGEADVITFGDEEMLHYIYQHAFRTPLTYESYKLINIADIISFTEKQYNNLDWQQIKTKYPLLYNALPFMHHIAPWNTAAVPDGFITSQVKKTKLPTASFAGWPHQRLKELKTKKRKWYRILQDTFLPPSWWVQVYYGVATKRGYLYCLLLKHPRHVLWWGRLYSSLNK